MNNTNTSTFHHLRQLLTELGSCDLSIEVNPKDLSTVLTFVSDGNGVSILCKEIYFFKFLADAPVADGLVLVEQILIDKNETEWSVKVIGPIDVQVKCFEVSYVLV